MKAVLSHHKIFPSHWFVQGHVEEELLEEREKRIENLEKEVSYVLLVQYCSMYPFTVIWLSFFVPTQAIHHSPIGSFLSLLHGKAFLCFHYNLTSYFLFCHHSWQVLVSFIFPGDHRQNNCHNLTVNILSLLKNFSQYWTVIMTMDQGTNFSNSNPTICNA